MPHALIIGAGVAGASAARVFVEQGWSTSVVDKAARPGGRCATRRFHAEPAGQWFDYGAQYFTARDAVFETQIQRDLTQGLLERWHPRICTATREDARWRLEASPDDRERLIGPNGINAWVRALFEQIDVDVQCRRRASRLARASRQWQATFTDGSSPIAADAAVVTLPARQAADLLGDSAPAWSALANADHALSPCHAVVVEAPALADCHGVFVHNGVLSWFADNHHKAGLARPRHLWTLHASAEYSAAHLDDDPDRVEATLVDEFAAITGLAANTIRPVHRHRWRHARPGAGAPGHDRRHEIDARTRIALAGDWLAGGRIEGAWLSGRAAARALVDT